LDEKNARDKIKKLHGEAQDANLEALEDFCTKYGLKFYLNTAHQQFIMQTKLAYFSEHYYTTILHLKMMKKGKKKMMERITVVFCCLIDGTKKEPWVIGKGLKPRCFKNIGELPVPIFSSKNPFITKNIFILWL
jgi:DDE superfamily endonuclease